MGSGEDDSEPLGLTPLLEEVPLPLIKSTVTWRLIMEGGLSYNAIQITPGTG